METLKFSIAILLLILGLASLALAESIDDEASISFLMPATSNKGVVDVISFSTNNLVKTTEYKKIYLIIVLSYKEIMSNAFSEAEDIASLVMVGKMI